MAKCLESNAKLILHRLGCQLREAAILLLVIGKFFSKSQWRHECMSEKELRGLASPSLFFAAASPSLTLCLALP
jgi:hypothetical protein